MQTETSEECLCCWQGAKDGPLSARLWPTCVEMEAILWDEGEDGDRDEDQVEYGNVENAYHTARQCTPTIGEGG